MTKKEIYHKAVGCNIPIDWNMFLKRGRLYPTEMRSYCYKECRRVADKTDTDYKCRQASYMMFNWMKNVWTDSNRPFGED